MLKVAVSAVGIALAPNFSNAGEAKVLIEKIKDKVPFQKESKSVSVLFSESFKVVGIGLMKTQVLEKHSTPTPAFLYVAEGLVEFRMSGKVYPLKAGEFFKIPPKEEHEIQALEDSRLLLTK